jgi:Haem-binding domain
LKKIIRRIALLSFVGLVIIQFFQTEKNSNTEATAVANDITKTYSVPDSVQQILRTSCFDCHSNNTHYPWYDNIQPVSWWLHHHIEEGKRELNFNEFSAYRIRKQYKKFEEIAEQVKKDEMPLGSYTLVHKDAVLTNDEKFALSRWAAAVMDSLKKKYPADSLKMPEQR